MKRKSIGFFYAINFWELHYGYGRRFLSERAGQRELSPEHPLHGVAPCTVARSIDVPFDLEQRRGAATLPNV